MKVKYVWLKWDLWWEKRRLRRWTALCTFTGITGRSSGGCPGSGRGGGGEGAGERERERGRGRNAVLQDMQLQSQQTQKEIYHMTIT